MYKKLQDPTACRLENFWWHVWGSDKRNLSGKTLARLWKQIASGPTFVPLKGPSRRPEKPPVRTRDCFGGPFPANAPEKMPHTRSMHESDTPDLPPNRDPRDVPGEDQASPSQFPSQNLTPSSSRPPPSHPILKKPRGPSTSGPRPTARFVDVPDSEEDAAQQSSASQQSGSGEGQPDRSNKDGRTSARSSSRTRSPSKMDRKPATAKKFVVSTTASKRRPVLPRRQSSQSSTGSAGSDSGSRDANYSVARPTNQQVVLVASPNEGHLAGRQAVSGLSTHVEEPATTTKALVKRPANAPSPGKQNTVKSGQQSRIRGASTTTAPKRALSPLSQGENARESSPDLQGISEALRPSAKALGKLPEAESSSANASPQKTNNPLGIYDGETGAKAAPFAGSSEHHEPTALKAVRGNAEPRGPDTGTQKSSTGKAHAAPAMARSKSNEPKRNSLGPVPAAAFKSPSVVGMSKFAVTGGFDFETPRARPSEEDLPPLGADQPDLPRSSVLDSKFTPTQPNPAPAPPMGRSKSQLTLLLERDKARIGDKHKVGGNSYGKDNGKKHG